MKIEELKKEATPGPFTKLESMTELEQVVTVSPESKEDLSTQDAPASVVPTQRKSSTCFSMKSLGLYPESSRLSKGLQILFSLLAAYGTFSPAKNASNDFQGYFTSPNEVTEHVSLVIAIAACIIVGASTLKGIGTGWDKLSTFAGRQDDQGERQIYQGKQLVETKEKLGDLTKLVRGQNLKIAALEKQLAWLSSRAPEPQIEVRPRSW